MALFYFILRYTNINFNCAVGRGCALQIGIARNERSFLGLRERVWKKNFTQFLVKIMLRILVEF